MKLRILFSGQLLALAVRAADDDRMKWWRDARFGMFIHCFAWGSMTRKANRLYLHVLRPTPEGIAFNGLKTRIARAWLLADRSQKLDVEQADGSVRVRVPSPPQDIFVIALELAGPVETDPAITGAYHWVKDLDIRLNREKMARQRARGWKARK